MKKLISRPEVTVEFTDNFFILLMLIKTKTFNIQHSIKAYLFRTSWDLVCSRMFRYIHLLTILVEAFMRLH